MKSNATNDTNIQVNTPQCLRVKNSQKENQVKTQQKECQIDGWMEDCWPLRTFCLSSVWGRSPEDVCWSSLWVPTDWWLWAHVVVPLVAKESACNQEDPWASMQNKKKTKWGWLPLMHSVLEVLVRHMVDAFQAGLLRIRQHNVPNGITNMAQPIGDAEPQAVHWVGINLQGHIAERSCWFQPLVELNAVLHPSVVKALRGLIQDLSFPETLAPFAAIASTCHPLLFLDHFPGADTAQNQATFHAPPPRRHGACPQDSSSSCSPSRRRRPRCSPWWVVCVSLVVLAIVALNGDEWGRGMAALPCSRVRMTYKLVPPPGAWHPGLSDSRWPPKGFRFMASMAEAE